MYEKTLFGQYQMADGRFGRYVSRDFYLQRGYAAVYPYRRIFRNAGTGCFAVYFVSVVYDFAFYRCRNKFALLSRNAFDSRFCAHEDTEAACAVDDRLAPFRLASGPAEYEPCRRI